ncbi:MAG: branched-chain amino acid ABC transporter permease [Rhodobacterales bacterium]|nr:branched-chain amino acid ABC transporter permease [Rhodobacterales bacterium]
MEWINVIVQGVLIGGLYALFAAGLSLIFGVMRLVNIAHGDLIVAAAYLAFVIVGATGLNPLLALVLVVPLMGLIGYVMQMSLLNRVISGDMLSPLIVTFGLSIIIQNGLLTVFTADSHKLSAGALDTGSFRLLPGLDIGYMPLLTFGAALAIIAGLQYLFYHTAMGRAFRAVSDDGEIAQIMGLENRRVFAWAMALSMAVVAVAGVFLALRTNFDPFIGPSRLLYGFEAVIIGGLGNLWGTLAGGVILGVAQGVGAKIDPGYQVLAGHIVFLVILAVRPRGLFPRIDG